MLTTAVSWHSRFQVKWRAPDKKALYFETYTRIQLYELPHVDCWRWQSRDVPNHHLVTYFTSTYFAVKFPSIFSRIRSSIGSKRVNLDVSLVSCSIQLYELPHVHQDIFFYQNKVSDLFCGDGSTKLLFFRYILPDY